MALFAEMFGPPPRLKERYVVQRALKQGTPLSLYRAVDAREGNRRCLVADPLHPPPGRAAR